MLSRLKPFFSLLISFLSSLFSGILIGFLLYNLVNLFIFPVYAFVMIWTLVGTMATAWLIYQQQFAPFLKPVKTVFSVSLICLIGLALIVPSNAYMVNRPHNLLLRQNMREVHQMLQADNTAGIAYPNNAQALEKRITAFFSPPLQAPGDPDTRQFTVDQQTHQQAANANAWRIIYAPQLKNNQVIQYELLGSSDHGKLLHFSKSPFTLRSQQASQEEQTQ